jgi:exopolyphosphatase/guanosine-5'-triphosphate,3'-diphosphate pyrophosphatase
LLSGIVRLLKPSTLITSTSGLREGLLYQRLSMSDRALDPFLEAARYEGGRLARFGFHGDALADWISPLFEDRNVRMAKLRRIACYLADTAWNITPEYRGDVALGLALDGNWPSANASDRGVLAAALLRVHNQGGFPSDLLASLCTPDDLQQAASWALAIRLAFRLDGGTGAALAESSVRIAGDRLLLSLSGNSKHLNCNSVERRLQQLANALGVTHAAVVIA